MTNAQHTPTQMARESAARWAKLNGRHQQAANIRRGSCDDAPIVQAFARHDQVANDLLGELIRTVEWLDSYLSPGESDPEVMATMLATVTRKISEARALLTKAGKDGQ